MVSDDTTTTETSLESTTTTDSTTTTTPFQSVDPTLAVFPDPTTSQRFDDPTAAALAFISDFVGFTNPIMGDFAQGDSRSGEVEVTPFAGGAPTTVLLRQLDDDSWFVIGAVTDSIRLAIPEALDAISSPQSLTGAAHAFEGTVVVRLFADGTQEPIAETFVTGRGDGVLGDFEGELTFTTPAGAAHGVLLLTSGGGEDGGPIAAQAIRVEL